MKDETQHAKDLSQPLSESPAEQGSSMSGNSKLKSVLHLWLMWLVGICLTLILIGLATPTILRCPKAADRTQAVSNAKQVGQVLIDFDNEFGSFPDDETVALVQAAVPTSLTLGGPSANDCFRQLLVYGTDSEKIFYCLHSELKGKPDDDIRPGRALEPGEVGFSYFCGLSTASPGATPILAAPMEIGANRFLMKPFDKKAVILRVDNSADTLIIRESDRKAMVGKGRTLLDPANGLWEGQKIDLRHPEK